MIEYHRDIMRGREGERERDDREREGDRERERGREEEDIANQERNELAAKQKQ